MNLYWLKSIYFGQLVNDVEWTRLKIQRQENLKKLHMDGSLKMDGKTCKWCLMVILTSTYTTLHYIHYFLDLKDILQRKGRVTMGSAKEFPSCLTNPITQKHLDWVSGEMAIWKFSYHPMRVCSILVQLLTCGAMSPLGQETKSLK